MAPLLIIQVRNTFKLHLLFLPEFSFGYVIFVFAHVRFHCTNAYKGVDLVAVYWRHVSVAMALLSIEVTVTDYK